MSISPVPPDLQSKIAEWRKRALTNELTQEEMIEAIKWLRQGRIAAASASVAARTKRAKAAIPDAGSLLAEMEGLE